MLFYFIYFFNLEVKKEKKYIYHKLERIFSRFIFIFIFVLHFLCSASQSIDLFLSKSFTQETCVEVVDWFLALLHAVEDDAFIANATLVGASAADFAAGSLDRSSRITHVLNVFIFIFEQRHFVFLKENPNIKIKSFQ